MKTPQSPAPVAGDEDTRPASDQPVEAIGAGREEKLHPHAQPFERYPDLALHIERMAVSGVIGSLISWEAFLRELNAALSPASPTRTPMGGEVEALRGALEATVAKRWEMVGTPTDSEAANAWALALDEIAVVAAQALAASSPSPAQGGESGHVGTIEVLENLLRSGGETWLNSEQEWALKSAIAALAASPQPAEDKLRDAISLILPLAKGYAAAHPVGSNQAYVDYVESFVSNEGDAISRPAAPSGGEKRAAIMREVKSYAACDDVGSAQWINALTSRLVEVTK